MERKKFSLAPVCGGITPRRCDTPRTQFRKDICQKRLSYFNTISQVDDKKTCISKEDNPVTASVSQTNRTINSKHSKTKLREIGDNLHNTRTTINMSDNGKLSQQPRESNQPPPPHFLQEHCKEGSFEGGSNTRFSFHPYSPRDHFSGHPAEGRLREGGVVHLDRQHPAERRHPTYPRHDDSDEVDLGLSTHRPSYSPLHQPMDFKGKLTLGKTRNQRYFGESLDSSSALSYDRFDPADLESVLGPERYERLLNNFNESHETLSLRTDHFPEGDRGSGKRLQRTGQSVSDGNDVNGMCVNSYGRASDDDDDDDSTYSVSRRFGQNAEQRDDNGPDDDLGLKTHRADGLDSGDAHLSAGEYGNSQVKSQIQATDSIKYSFLASEIYAEADKLNNNSALSKQKFGESQTKPVCKVDYRDSVSMSLNVFERPTQRFGKGDALHKPLPWEVDGKPGKLETWRERGYIEVANSSHNLQGVEGNREGKQEDLSTGAEKCMVSSAGMTQSEDEMLPRRRNGEAKLSTVQRKSPPSVSACRLDQLPPADCWSESSSLKRYFCSLENLSKGSDLLADGFEPIPDAPVNDVRSGSTVKTKHIESYGEVKPVPPQRKSTDSLRSSRSSLQRHGKKGNKSKTSSKGKGQCSPKKPAGRMNMDSDDWDISDVTLKSFAWSEQSSEVVSKLDHVKRQKDRTSTENKSGVNVVTGRMSYVNITASRDADDRFTDVSSLVISEASSLQDWVIGGNERRSDDKSSEDAKPSAESKQDNKKSEEITDHFQEHSAASTSTSGQHHNLPEDLEHDIRMSDGDLGEKKFDEEDTRCSRRNAWQEPAAHLHFLMRVCPECSTQNGEFETWCRECRCILAHVAPIPAPTRVQQGSPRVTAGEHRGNMIIQPGCSWYREDIRRSPETLHDTCDDEGSVTDSCLHRGSSKDQVDVHGKRSERIEFSDKDKSEPLEEGLASGNNEMDNVVSHDQETFSSANSTSGHIMGENHKPDIPLHLRISLDSSVDSHSGHRFDANDRQGAVWRNAARISEAGEFEYREPETANVSLSEVMKEELSLDLRASHDSTVAGGAVRSGCTQAPVEKACVALSGAGAIAACPVDPVPDDQCRNGHDNEGNSMKDLDYPKVSPPAYGDHDFEEDNNDVDSRQKQSVGPGGDDGHSLQGDRVAENRDDDDDDDDGDVAVVDSNYHSFINWLITDPQFHTSPAKGVAVPQPKKSKGRPKTAGNARPEKSQTSGSQKSLSKSPCKKKWASSRPSVSASFSYDDFARCSGSNGSSKKRPSSAKMLSTSGLFVSQNKDEGKRDSSIRHSQIASARSSGKEKSKNSVNKSRSLLKSSSVLQSVSETDRDSKTGDMLTVQSAPIVKGAPPKSLFSAVDPYAMYIAMSPRINSGDVSLWLCLPDEILLHILSFLTLPDLAKCARTCKQFRRVAADGSLWRNICLKKRHDLYDDWLIEIGKKRPQRLTLEYCHGDYVTANGLRELFRDCADTLQELSFAGCSRGQLTGDNILLHAASRCKNITHLDASWCNINDNGVIAISDTSHQLRSLCINGCQALSDETIHKLVVKHGIYLHRLELFGCFNITARSMASMANNCKGLVTLNLGQCWKVTDNSISQLSASLGMVEHLDIRGCKQIRDLCVHHIMKNCPRLVKFSIANCPNITDGTLAEIATYATQIKSLDVCGCHNITDVGVKAIATCCQQLELLDLSSTRATHRSVSVLATSSTGHLQVLKVSFCKNITTACLIRLVRNCKRLTALLVYGISGVRNLDELRIINSRLSIEM